MYFVWLCSLDEHWAVNQGKIYLSAVSIRFINRVETETVVILEIWR